MSFQKKKNQCLFLSGRHHFGTVITGAFITKTSRFFSIGKKTKRTGKTKKDSMAVFHDTFKADCLGHLLDNILKQSVEACEKLATKNIKTTGGVFLEIEAKTGSVALS